MRVEEAEFRADLARSETITVRQRLEKRIENIGLAFECEKARTDLALRAELIQRYPHLRERFADYDNEP